MMYWRMLAAVVFGLVLVTRSGLAVGGAGECLFARPRKIRSGNCCPPTCLVPTARFPRNQAVS